MQRRGSERPTPGLFDPIGRVSGNQRLGFMNVGWRLFLVGWMFWSGSLAAQISREIQAVESIPDMLERLADQADPEQHPFLNELRVERYESSLRQMRQSGFEYARTLESWAEELLRCGRAEEAAVRWGEVARLRVQGMPGRDGSRSVSGPRLAEAVAWMRLGEQENCLAGHSPSACILPFDAEAVHRRRRPMQEAIRILQVQLEADASDLSARWLLNLAWMAAGGYPDRVPRKHLIPPEVFRSFRDVPGFTNRAAALALDDARLSGRAVAEDFDGDGDIDLVVTSLGMRHPIKYYRNNGDGTFTERAREAGLDREWGGLNVQQTDYNNDGLPDLFVLRGGWFGEDGRLPKSLLKNLGGGVFTNVTREAGLLSLHPTQTAAWADFDGDGWLDVMIGHETRGGHAHACQLFRNRGDGTFESCGESAGVGVSAWVKGVAAGDYDNDGKPDLYLSVLGGKNVLFRNRCRPGLMRFEDASEAAGVQEPWHSFPTWFFDFDQDGWEDLFVVIRRRTSVKWRRIIWGFLMEARNRACIATEARADSRM